MRFTPTFFISLILLIPCISSAQQMPDAAQMSGTPLAAPELPNGTVTVRLVREEMGNNIANHPVKLVAAGTAQQATTDAQGRAQFTGLPVGTVVYAEAVVGDETLRSKEFDIPARGGVRVALVAGIAAAAARDRAARDRAAQEPARSGIVVFGGESRIILEFQDDNLQAFYLLDIVNQARTPIDPGQSLILQLPEQASGVALMGGSSPLASIRNNSVVITGPFPPGTTAVQLGYTIPYQGDRVALQQRWPAVMEQLFVAIEKIGQVQLASPQFTAQRDAQAGGQPFVMATGGRLNAGDTLTLEITGLPHRSTLLRDVGVGAAFLMLLAGLWAAFTAAPARRGQTAQLEARKEKLFAELVALETQHARGRIDESRYASRRQTLVAQLERVIGELDRAPASGGEDLAA